MGMAPGRDPAQDEGQILPVGRTSWMECRPRLAGVVGMAGMAGMVEVASGIVAGLTAVFAVAAGLRVVAQASFPSPQTCAARCRAPRREDPPPLP